MGSIKILGRTGLALLLAVFVLMTSAGTGYAEPEKDYPVKMTVDAGYMGMARLGSKVPFHITVENTGSEVTGEVYVEVPVSDNTMDSSWVQTVRERQQP